MLYVDIKKWIQDVHTYAEANVNIVLIGESFYKHFLLNQFTPPPSTYYIHLQEINAIW